MTKRLLEAGLVILGKTNLDEFAMGSSTEHSAYGPTRNPWDLDRIPGGSGGGSAAALAAFEAPLAIGTDTGGSIRQPASVTGTVGVKPTYGGTSRYGVIAMASSLDQPGPCARTVAGRRPPARGHLRPRPDGLDLDRRARAARWSRPRARATCAACASASSRSWAARATRPGSSCASARRWTLLRAAGAEIVEVSCPHFDYALGAYYLIMPSEVSSNLARYDAMRYGLRVGDDGTRSTEEVMKLTRDAGFGDEVKRRIIIGTYALSSGYYDAYYGSAQKVRTLISRDFDAAFEQVDVLVSPSTPTTAFKLGEKIDDPLAMYKSDLCTIPSNMAGNASGVVPVRAGARGRPAGRLPGDGAAAGRRPGLPGGRRAGARARRARRVAS